MSWIQPGCPSQASEWHDLSKPVIGEMRPSANLYDGRSASTASTPILSLLLATCIRSIFTLHFRLFAAEAI